MKKIVRLFFIVLLIFGILLPGIVFGQTPTETEEEGAETIERIKDLVASRAAELNLVERRGILGTVQEASNSQIKVSDHLSNPRAIDIDELTNFNGDDDEDSFGISDIENGDVLSIVGLFNKDSERLRAVFLSKAENVPLNIDGVIAEIDEEDFTMTIADAKKSRITVDIERSTRTNSYEDGDTERSGFSRLEVGQRVIVVGFANSEEDLRMSASRITHFISIPPSEAMEEARLESEEAQTSTESAS